jgi:NADH-quinone oxidoreductase subunit G
MLDAPRSAYVLMGSNRNWMPTMQRCAPRDARAEFVVALSAFKTPRRLCRCAAADCAVHRNRRQLVNMEGRLQSFHGVVKPKGEARPAWKVLRVLGNLLSLGGFDYDTAEAVRADAVQGDLAAITEQCRACQRN